jgi:hypothetical protein
VSDPESIITPIRRTLRRLVAATVVVFVFSIGVAGYAWTNSGENRDALCALRADVEQRVAVSETLLREKPDGELAAAIRVSLEGQQRTVAALTSLSC